MTSASIPALSAVILAGLVGVAAGIRLARFVDERRRRQRTERDGITVFQMLQRIVDLAPVGTAVVDTHRDVVFRNDRAVELGLVRDRLLDDRAWRAAQQTLTRASKDPEDEAPDVAGEVEFDLSSGEGASSSGSSGSSGSVGPVQPARSGMAVRGRTRLLWEQDRRFAVVFVDDQSEYARMEATRRDFVANVSHELKTPVGAMGVLAEALLASADDPDTVRQFGEMVLVESGRLATMVSELIELSRLQGGEALPDLEEVDVDAVVAEAISRHKVAADKASIVMTTDAATGYRVPGDRTLLVTALANLVSNAIAYSPAGSAVSISRRRHGDVIEIAVTDRGIGIAPDDQERVFERFFRGDKARSRATGGSGLGLAIVKHIVANHNGTVTVWSQPGTGSTFTLAIPEYRRGQQRTAETARPGDDSPDAADAAVRPVGGGRPGPDAAEPGTMAATSSEKKELRR